MGEAKSRLSDLVRRAERGETVILARAGVPVAQLVPLAQARQRRLGGWHAALGEQPSGWDEKLRPDEVFPGLYEG
jgi:prevent-host-death family protein